MSIMFDLQKFKDEKKITQAQIAQVIGVKQGYVSRILKGHYQLSDAHIRILCDAYGVSLDEYALKNEAEGSDDLAEQEGNCVCPYADTIAGVVELMKGINDMCKSLSDTNKKLVEQQSDLIRAIMTLTEKRD